MIEPLPEGITSVTGPADTTAARVRPLVRNWWWVALLVVALAVVGVVNQSDGTTDTPLHPRNPGPNGAMAAAEILGREGIDVVTVTTVADAVAALDGPTTILLADPQHLSPQQRAELAAAGADVVIAGNPYATLEGLTDAVAPTAAGTATPVRALCTDPDAAAAARVSSSIGGVRAVGDAEVCFPTVGDSGVYAVWDQAGATWRYLAEPALLTNELLAQDGNAALALRALGHNPRLVWLLPTPGSADTTGGVSPLPPLFGPLALLAAGLVLALALWQGRHMGRVVTEPLPVVVRPGEAVLGRGRLYRRARATSHAAAALRAGTARRLARQLGVSRSAGPETLVPAIASATHRTPAEVADLLYRRAPASNAELLDLSTALHTLEREVHHDH